MHALLVQQLFSAFTKVYALVSLTATILIQQTLPVTFIAQSFIYFYKVTWTLSDDHYILSPASVACNPVTEWLWYFLGQ